jgi:hypothetical protein
MTGVRASKTWTSIQRTTVLSWKGQASKTCPDQFRERRIMSTIVKQMASGKRRERQLKLRGNLWSKIKPTELWDRTHDGFATMPRTMPIILEILNSLSKGFPVSSTYLDLWCRDFGESFVTLNKPPEMAFSAGFSKQRGIRTWKSRIEILAKLGFIVLAKGPSGPASHALILNPYLVIKRLNDKGKIEEGLYNALFERALEVGADDLE